MLAVAIQAEILRLHYAERWGSSQIARHLGIHRQPFVTSARDPLSKGQSRRERERPRPPDYWERPVRDTIHYEATRVARDACAERRTTQGFAPSAASEGRDECGSASRVCKRGAGAA